MWFPERPFPRPSKTTTATVDRSSVRLVSKGFDSHGRPADERTSSNLPSGTGVIRRGRLGTRSTDGSLQRLIDEKEDRG